MSQKTKMEALYDTADKFINIANELSQKDTSGGVGAGMRFAAARYSIFEMTLAGKNLAEEKEAIKEELLRDYTLMLEENLQAYIRHTEAQNKEKLKVFS